MRIVLASKSPRRRELLSEIYDSFEIITADTDETLPEGVELSDGVRLLAIRKGEAVLPFASEGDMIISSDTLVELDGVPLGKPTDESDARDMLSRLSGNRHNVHTGVAIHYRGKVFSGVDTTAVYFREMTEGEILDYIATGEPMDKAGSYGIQGLGGRFVQKYDGNYDTVVGLSLTLLRRLIKECLESDEA